jgi:hypothetical protein
MNTANAANVGYHHSRLRGPNESQQANAGLRRSMTANEIQRRLTKGPRDINDNVSWAIGKFLLFLYTTTFFTN